MTAVGEDLGRSLANAVSGTGDKNACHGVIQDCRYSVEKYVDDSWTALERADKYHGIGAMISYVTSATVFLKYDVRTSGCILSKYLLLKSLLC